MPETVDKQRISGCSAWKIGEVMRSAIKWSKCKFCEKAIVFDENCDKVIAHYKCAIDNEDMSFGCQEGLCHYYERDKKNNERSKQ